MEKVTIGNAELYHGDCMEILPTLPKVDAVVTDPPYGMDFQSNHRKIDHSKIAGDVGAECLNFAASIEANHSLYVFCRWDNLREVPKPKSCITWVKPNWSMGDLEHEHGRQSEVCLFWPGVGHKWPDKRPSDVISAPRTGNDYHPTEKPVYLMEQIIKWTAGAVIDPFMGSGTTGVARMNLGRKFIGIELERKYFDIACQRIEQAQKQVRMFE